jgi:hypothetical protein
MLEEYQMFIIGLVARENDPTFDELTGVLLQEEECRNNLNSISHNSYLALVEKGKQPYKGNPWRTNKEGKPHTKPDNGSSPQSTNTNVKKNEGCFYYGKLGHYAKYCRRWKFNESKYNKHSRNYVVKGARVCDDSKNIKCFVYDTTLSAHTMMLMHGLVILVHQFICHVIGIGLIHIMKTLMTFIRSI